MTATTNFTIYQGDNFERTFQLRQRDSQGNETLIDISNKTFEADVRPAFTKRVVASFDITTHISESRVILRLDSFVTADLAPGRHVFDLEYFPNGDRSRTRKLIVGELEILPEVTRRGP